MKVSSAASAVDDHGTNVVAGAMTFVASCVALA